MLPGRNLKNCWIECSNISGLPLSRFAPARKSVQIISKLYPRDLSMNGIWLLKHLEVDDLVRLRFPAGSFLLHVPPELFLRQCTGVVQPGCTIEPRPSARASFANFNGESEHVERLLGVPSALALSTGKRNTPSATSLLAEDEQETSLNPWIRRFMLRRPCGRGSYEL